MRVSDIATLDVRPCRPETNLAAVASIMWEHDCGVVPVVDDRNQVLGVVTDRDVCMAVGTRNRLASQIAVAEVMSGKLFTCRLTDDVRTALRIMSANGVRRLPVLDEKGSLAGILSLTDVILASRDTRGARAGDLTWADTVPLVDAICRPRIQRELPANERKEALAVKK